MEGRNCKDCKWCWQLRGIWGLDCEWYKMYFDNTDRAASCCHYEQDDEDGEEGEE